MITFSKMEAQAVCVILRAIVLLLLVTSDAVNGLKCLDCRSAPADSCSNEVTCPLRGPSGPVFHCASRASKTVSYTSSGPVAMGPELLIRGCAIKNAFKDNRMNACATSAELTNGAVEDPPQPSSKTYTPFHYSVYCVCDKDLCNKAPPTATGMQACLAQTFFFFLFWASSSRDFWREH